jgi:hypothetical protein
MTTFSLEQLRILNEAITSAPEVEQGRIEAANAILAIRGHNVTINRHEDALTVLRQLEEELMECGDYRYAATLLLGAHLFNAEPHFVRRIFAALHSNSDLLLLCGSASSSKTYSSAAWHYIDWRRWPEGTTIKVAALSEDHLRKNVFAHISEFHKAAQEVVPMPHKIKETDLFLGVEEAGDAVGFSGVAFQKGNLGTGHFKGYKSKPTRRSHKTLGNFTRLRILADEAQQFGAGPFSDFGSTLASTREGGTIKATLCFNPDATHRPVVVLAEPEQGWVPDDIDSLYDWESKRGWRVLRLDAAQLENVIQRKEIYRGFQTYEGYMRILKEAGDNGEKYFWACRGFPPVKGSSSSVIPPAWVTECRGEADFLPGVESLVTTDMAYAGIDKPTMCVWRWGKAIGWRKQDGQYVTYRDRQTLKEKPRFVLQLDQIIYLEKADQTIMAAEEIQGKCNDLGVSAENVAIDSTGAGLGTASHLKMYWGDVLAVNWGEGATDGKILAEDVRSAKEQYDGLISEMWFSARRWMDPTVNVLLINPIVPSHPLNTQLTTRRYKWAKEGKQRVEKKDEWKARHQGLSPDEADSFVMGPLLVRLRKPVLPGLVEQVGSEAKANDDHVAKMEPVDIPESLDGMGGGEEQLEQSE